MRTNRETIVIGGDARLPRELSAGESFQVVLELDVETCEVIDVFFSPCAPIVQKYLGDLIIGKNLETDMNEVMDHIEKRLLLKTRKAIIAAMRDLIRRYNEHKYGPLPSQQQVS